MLLDPPVYTPGENPEFHRYRRQRACRRRRAGSPGTSRKPAPAATPAPAAMPAPAESAASQCGLTGGVRCGSATAARRRGLESRHRTCRERRYALQNCAKLECRYRGQHRSDDDRFVPFESRCVRRQHQHIAQRLRAARSRRRRYRRPESKRGNERSSPSNGYLEKRRRFGGGCRPAAICVW